MDIVGWGGLLFIRNEFSIYHQAPTRNYWKLLALSNKLINYGYGRDCGLDIVAR